MTLEPSRPWILWLAAAISIVAACSPRDLWAPDEPRYGRVAYEMEQGGDWLVPHWAGHVDAEKPPLGYWAMAVSGRVFGGVGPVSARLPGALFAALAVLVTARLGRLWFGSAALGETAALLFATSALVLWNSSRAGLDLPLTAFVLLATWAGCVAAAKPSLRAATACGACLGLGVLVKGPHALYVPIAAIVGGCVASGTARRLRDPRWLATLAAAMAVIAAWLVPALAENEKGFGARLLGQLLTRVSGQGEPHLQPFPYLIGTVLLAGLPWTTAWLGGGMLAATRKRAPVRDRFGLGASLVGAVVPLLLLSVPASKREIYLIPLLPCLALLAAYALHCAPRARLSRATVWVAVASLSLVALTAFAAPLVAPHVWPGGPDEVVAGAALAAGTAPYVLGAVALTGALATFLLCHAPVSAVRAAGAAIAVAWIAAALLLLPRFDDRKTWRAAVEPVRRAAQDAPLVACGFDDASLQWAFRPTVVEHVASEPGSVPRTLDALFAAGAPTVVAAIETKDWESALASIPSLAARTSIVWKQRVGSKHYTVLVAARPTG